MALKLLMMIKPFLNHHGTHLNYSKANLHTYSVKKFNDLGEEVPPARGGHLHTHTYSMLDADSLLTIIFYITISTMYGNTSN